MPIVKKKNRQLTVSNEAVQKYLKEGYDQINDKGKVINKATGGRMVSLAEYNLVSEENEKLKKEIAKLRKPEQPEQ